MCYKCKKLGYFLYQCLKGWNFVGMVVDGKGFLDYSNLGKCVVFIIVIIILFVFVVNNFSILNIFCNVSVLVGSLFISDGIFNEYFVKVLRDIGCNGVVVC